MKANTKGQCLPTHCYAVGYLSTIIAKILTNDNINNNILLAIFNAGCLHDIGKVAPTFQKWVRNSTENNNSEDGQHINNSKFYETNPRHNELSLILFHLLRNESDKSINSKNIELIEHVIYWHHAKPIRKTPFKNLQDIYNKIDEQEWEILFNSTYDLIKQINKLSDTYQLIKFKKTKNDIRLKLELPKYKDYNLNDNLNDYKQDIAENAYNSFARSVIITADRIISDLYAHELDYYVDNNLLHNLAEFYLSKPDTLSQSIKQCLRSFDINYPNSDRNIQQSKAAKELANIDHIAVLQGAAGCGKTKIALEWAYHTNAKKIIWVCPRVSVCQNIYQDLTSDEYLKNVNVEICTGDFKYISINGIEMPNEQSFVGDVVITTIDQLSNTILTHKHIVSLLDAMNSHVIFDEYHEYIPMDAYNLLFAEFLHCKRLLKENTNTLLVSATPNPIYIEELLEIHKGDCIKVGTFNDKPYTIKFEEYNSDSDNIFTDTVKDNTFVISNTVSTAQKSFLMNAENENSILWHGALKPNDTIDIFHKIINGFGKNGNGSYDILRSSHIIQASINISCGNMISDVSNAENILQRMGRLNRFAENADGILTIAIPTNFEKNNVGMGKFLYIMHMYDSSRAWVDYLQSKKLDNITLDDIYSYYDEFYTIGKYRQSVTKDILKSLKSSVGTIGRNVLDPVVIKQSKDTSGQFLKKNNLRADCRFITSAVCDVSYNKVVNYCYDYVDGMTMDYNRILGYGDSNKNLLAYMHQKHHKMTNSKKSHKDFILGDAARNSNNPIYLSYTEKDLAKCNETNHPHAIYYAVHAKQSVGLIDAKNLNF